MTSFKMRWFRYWVDPGIQEKSGKITQLVLEQAIGVSDALFGYL